MGELTLQIPKFDNGTSGVILTVSNDSKTVHISEVMIETSMSEMLNFGSNGWVIQDHGTEFGSPTCRGFSSLKSVFSRPPMH